MKVTYRLVILLVALEFLFPNPAEAVFKIREEVIVEDDERVPKVVCIGGDIHVYGTVENDVAAIGGDIIVESGGKIRGDAITFGGDIMVKEDGLIMGELVSIGGSTNAMVGSYIHGDLVTSFPEDDDIPVVGDLGNMISRLVKFIIFGPVIGIFSILGVLFVLILSLGKLLISVAIAAFVTYFFPRNVDAMAECSHRDFGINLLLGIAVIISVPLIVIGLLITLIGIPVIPMFLMFIFLSYLFGSVGVSLLIGRKMPNAALRTDMTNVILGVLVLGLIKLLPVVGLLVKIFLVVFSIGVVFISRFGTQPYAAAR